MSYIFSSSLQALEPQTRLVQFLPPAFVVAITVGQRRLSATVLWRCGGEVCIRGVPELIRYLIHRMSSLDALRFQQYSGDGTCGHSLYEERRQ
jgi:hypothetical protein